MVNYTQGNKMPKYCKDGYCKKIGCLCGYCRFFNTDTGYCRKLKKETFIWEGCHAFECFKIGELK
jgi:hypothetical protein